VNFDDQDWERAHPSSEEPGDGSTVWKVAAGVAVGVVLGGALVYVADRYLTQQATAEFVQSIRQLMPGADRSAERQPVEPKHQAAAQEAATLSREQEAQQRQAEQQRVAEAIERSLHDEADRKAQATRQATQAAAERKERAWARFYSRPPQCDDNPTKAMMVECANQFIRARRQFEESYASGNR